MKLVGIYIACLFFYLVDCKTQPAGQVNSAAVQFYITGAPDAFHKGDIPVTTGMDDPTGINLSTGYQTGNNYSGQHTVYLIHFPDIDVITNGYFFPEFAMPPPGYCDI